MRAAFRPSRISGHFSIETGVIVDNAKVMTSYPLMKNKAPLETDIDADRPDALPQRVRKEILALISSGELAGGERITEMGIAGRLNVSRGPVREAFKSLEEAGILRMERNAGVTVRLVSREDAAEIHEVRSYLDECASRAIAGRLSTVQLSELATLIREMDMLAGEGDVRGFYQSNLTFHTRIVQWTCNATLLASYNRLVAELHLFRQRGLEPTGEMQRSNEGHRLILEGIAAGDAEEAALQMRRHTALGRRRLLLTDLI